MLTIRGCRKNLFHTLNSKSRKRVENLFLNAKKDQLEYIQAKPIVAWQIVNDDNGNKPKTCKPRRKTSEVERTFQECTRKHF